MKTWVAVCSIDLTSTRFVYEIVAPTYTDALVKAYLRLQKEHPESSEGHAVLALDEI